LIRKVWRQLKIAERRRNNSRTRRARHFCFGKKSRPLRGEALSGLVGEVLRGGG
jgi:hypothetical protein